MTTCEFERLLDESQASSLLPDEPPNKQDDEVIGRGTRLIAHHGPETSDGLPSIDTKAFHMELGKVGAGKGLGHMGAD